MSAPVITVFGSGTCLPDTLGYRSAHALGRAIAEAGWTLCNGGYGGTMEAAAKGAREAGGHTIGVSCRIPPWQMSCNRYVQQEVPTFSLLARLDILLRLGDAYVVLPGGTGTLLEFALVWEFVNKGLFDRRPPIVLLGDHWTPVIGPVQREQPAALDPLIARNPAEVVELLRGVLKT